MNKYEQLTKDIVSALGGVENIQSVTHCATRLRFEYFQLHLTHLLYL